MAITTILRFCAVLLCTLGFQACSTTGSAVSPADSPTIDVHQAQPSADSTRTGMDGDEKTVPAIIGIPPSNDVDATYRIGTDDLLRIEVFRVEDLSSEERVNEEGFVIMPLIGAVEVGGLTPRQAERLLADKLRKFVRSPQVNVFVTEYASQNVTVSGAVKKSGVFPLTGRTTLSQAIAESGGIDRLANAEEVVIFRLRDDQSTQAYVVNLEKIQDGTLRDPTLVGSDRVFVPKSGTAVFFAGLTDTLRGFVRIPVY